MTHSEAIMIRRDAALMLEHAIARIGYYGHDGWPNVDNDNVCDAAHIMQHRKWSLEAMDSPASNRFWDEQRRDYNAMLESIEEREEYTEADEIADNDGRMFSADQTSQA